LQTFGAKVAGVAIPIPIYALKETVPGAIYEIRIKTNKPAPPQTIETIKRVFAEKCPSVKIHYIEVDGNNVTIQLEGSPIAWETILALLPLIFTLLGLVILLVAVFSLISAIPSYVWALLIVGAITLFIVPGLIPKVKLPKKAKK
jgi:hypothetical protein